MGGKWFNMLSTLKIGKQKLKKETVMNTTIENNKIIAEFMGAKEIITETTHRIYKEFEMYGIIESIEDREDIKHFYQPEEMLFNSDWNWLMEVVEKIEETEIENNILMLESIGNEAKFIYDDGCRFLNSNIGETKIEAVYNACIEFIKWYNEQNKV